MPTHHHTPADRREIIGSHRTSPSKAKNVGAVPADQTITASVYLAPSATHAHLTGSTDERRAQVAAHRAEAHKDGINALVNFASEHGLKVESAEPARRLVRISGTATALADAFGADMAMYEEHGHRYHARTGSLSVPAEIHALVESVLGLDSRPAAEPHIVRPRAEQPGSVQPNKLAQLYDFPTGADGTGVTIALIELGGGFYDDDNETAFKAMKLKTPKVTAVSVDGGENDQSGSDADGEVALDIQVAGGVAPGAEIAVYFCPNTDAGFVDAITQASHDTTHKPSVISISWGSPEDTWDRQSMTSMTSALKDAAALGISVYVASGDNLATDGEDDGSVHVDFPASSPYAIGCGGTHIMFSGTTITKEVVWNDGDSGTGGGISDVYPVPAFQAEVKLPPNVSTGRPGRGVPDVSGNAAPASGYVVVVGGQAEVVGGTSAVAPLWAGLTALINQKAAEPVGFLPTWLYANRPKETTLTAEPLHGNNCPSGTQLGYSAEPGWSACTGLGRPNGAALFAALAKAVPVA